MKRESLWIAKATQIIYGIFFIYLGVFIFYIQKEAYWSVGDEFNILISNARGLFRTNPVEGTRFYPFWGIENNLLLPFGRNFIPYMLLRLSLFLSYMYLLFKMTQTKTMLTPILLICMLATKDMFEIFSPSYFQEALVLPLIAFYMYQVLQYASDKKWHRLLIALFCVIICTYQKEIYFMPFFGYAIFMFLFQKERTKEENIFYLTLIGNAIVFFVLYYNLRYIHFKGSYGGGSSKKMIELLIEFITVNPFFVWFILLALIRCYYLFLKKDRRFLYADIFLFMGIVLYISYPRVTILAYNRYVLPVYTFSFVAIAIYFNYYKEHLYQLLMQTKKVKVLSLFLLLTLCGHGIIGVFYNVVEINRWLKERRYSRTEVVFFSELLDRGYSLKMNSRVNRFFDIGIRSLISVMYHDENKYKDNLDAMTTFTNPTKEEIAGKTVFMEVPYWVSGENFFKDEEELHELGLQRIPNIPNINNDYFIINPIYTLYTSPNNISEVEDVIEETIQKVRE